MSNATTRPTPAATTADPAPRSRAYAVLVGVTSLVILLQGLWAGLFVHEGKDYADGWVEVHARGADLAILLALVATVLAVAKLRARRDLVFGSAALLVLLVLESYLGGLVGDSPSVTAIHIPLAMALMALAVWLPMRARR